MDETLGQALEREHREIDAGIARFAGTGAASAGDSAAGLETALDRLRRHIYLEEEHLFPPLSAAGMVGPVFVMTREHAEMWQWAEQLAAAAAGGDWAAAAARCRELASLLDAHNGKEEAIVYAGADRVLAPQLRAELTDLVATAAMPDGWVCEGARA